MTPEWVQTLDEYWNAVEDALEESGGYLAESYLTVKPVANVLLVEKQRLVFHDGSFLDLAMSIRDDLTLIAYKFHYARFDGQLVWRYDNHRSGHEAEDGGRTHVHLSDVERKPDAGTDIFEVLERIIIDQNDERRHPSA